MAIIYKITNTTNNKAYIGATIHPLEDRWGRHLSAAFNDDSQMAIHKALRKYGKEVFKIEVLHEDPDPNLIFDVLEPRYIQEHKTYGNDGYNMTLGGDGWLGMKHTPESLEKMRAAKLGKKMSEETKQKLSENSSFRGKAPWNKGKKCPELGVWLGKSMSEETRKKISEANIGRMQLDSQKEKVREDISEKHKVQIISTGEIIEVHNLRQFCKDHNLSQGNLCHLGKTKGYKMIETTKKVREYTIENSITGEVFKTNNLKKFCKERKLDNSRMYGKNDNPASNGGWRLTDTTITEVIHKY